MRGESLATLVYFGEGATSSSEFHNAMNFAGVYKTPTVFLCRNNGWAISVPVEMQTGSQTFAQKGFAYGVRAVRVDGNDLLAVYKVTRDAVLRARAGEGPTLIECLTHRLSGHSTSDDPSAYRSKEEMEQERAHDPIPRLRQHVEGRGLDAMLATLGLADHRGRYPSELSLGLARRVALARAFIVEPDLLLTCAAALSHRGNSVCVAAALPALQQPAGP